MTSRGWVCAIVSVVAVSTLLVWTGGCGVPATASGAPTEQTGPTIPNDPEPAPASSGATTGADAFAKAISWDVAPGTPASLSGTLHSTSQVDVFEIGPVLAGDRFHVEVLSSELDAAVAIFDGDEDLLIANDDRSYYGGLVEPLINAVARSDSPGCFIAVSSSPLKPSTGAYTLQLLLYEGEPATTPEPQRVYLNFDGAEAVAIGTRPAIDIPVFDPSVIDPAFTGQGDEIAGQIVSSVEQDFAGLNVTFHSSREGPPPPEPYTTVHFGAYDAALLGVAENVDEFNERHDQQAIIFVDTFAAFAVLEPSVEEISQALANVTSHETGHLLGLQHTEDPRGVMDVTASLRQLLGDQAFLRSPLNAADVFPVGHQDAPWTLFENVGGDLATAKRAAQLRRSAPTSWYDEGTGPPARARHCFAACAACAENKSR